MNIYRLVHTCVALSAVFVSTAAWSASDSPPEYLDPFEREIARIAGVQREACLRFQDHFMPLIYNAETYARIAAQEGKVPKQLLETLRELKRFVRHLDAYRMSLGTAVDVYVGELTTSQPKQSDPYWSFPNGGGCLKRELRNPVYQGRELATGLFDHDIYRYEVYCVSSLEFDQVRAYNGAVALREGIKDLNAQRSESLNAYEYYEKVTRLVDLSRKGEAEVCKSVD